jgi:hypothetical protein
MRLGRGATRRAGSLGGGVLPLAALVMLTAGSAAAGPAGGLFGIVAVDSRPFEQRAGYGAEARFGWGVADAVALETSLGVARSAANSWLVHLGVGPKLALFADAPFSPYVRANAGLGVRTPWADIAGCQAASGPVCPPTNDFDTEWAFSAAAGLGLGFRVVDILRVSGELGWRRYFFEGRQFPRDLRGLWLGLSFG